MQCANYTRKQEMCTVRCQVDASHSLFLEIVVIDNGIIDTAEYNIRGFTSLSAARYDIFRYVWQYVTVITSPGAANKRRNHVIWPDNHVQFTSSNGNLRRFTSVTFSNWNLVLKSNDKKVDRSAGDIERTSEYRNRATPSGCVMPCISCILCIILL